MSVRRKDPEYTQSIYGLLAIISIGPTSGYGVRKALDDREMYYWRESSGNIYPMLRQLHADGLLDRTDSYVKKKKRVVYSITEKGREELNLWLGEPAGLSRFRVELLMKLRFGTALGIETLVGHLAHYRRQLEQQLDEVREIITDIDESGDSVDSDIRRIAATRIGMEMETLLHWCDLSRDILLKRRNRGLSESGRGFGHHTLEQAPQSYQGICRIAPWWVPRGVTQRLLRSM